MIFNSIEPIADLIDEEKANIVVLRVVYSRRDQDRILKTI
jgi:hypothetical protein